MNKRWAALFLSINLTTVGPAYAMESKDISEAENELGFDMTGLLWSGLLAFIGLYFDSELKPNLADPAKP